MRRGFTVFGLLFALIPAANAADIDGLSLPFKAVRVSSPVQEIIAEIQVQEGEVVKKDQPLARLRDEKEVAEHKRATEILKKREFDQKAASSLATDRITSREKLLEAEIELELAKVDVDVAQQKVDEKLIRAPLDGVVIRKLREAGESVDRVEPLFEMVDTSKLYLQFHVDPDVAARLEKGRTHKFWVAGKTDKKYDAVVDFISPAADPASGLFRVKLLFDNPNDIVRAGVRVVGDL